MTTINDVKKAVAKLEKSTFNKGLDQCNLGATIRAYKAEQVEVNVKPKDIYAELEVSVGYKKAMVCQLIQLADNRDTYNVIFTLSASRYIQKNKKNEQFISNLEQYCADNESSLIEEPQLKSLMGEKSESDKSTREKMSGALKTAVSIALKGKKLGDYDYAMFVEQVNSELIQAVKESFENE